jgi:hypothetical protein
MAGAAIMAGTGIMAGGGTIGITGTGAAGKYATESKQSSFRDASLLGRRPGIQKSGALISGFRVRAKRRAPE